MEWPSQLMALRAVGLLAALLSGPFSSRSNRLGWAARVMFSGGTLAAWPQLRPRLWRSRGYAAHTALMVAEALCERANARRLRRKYAAHCARAAAAAESAAAAHKKLA